jgi:hypothetical protein
MTEPTAVERALATAGRDLAALERPFALVGGLAVSVRAEVRFTRDVDFAVVVTDDTDAEALVYSLRELRYAPTESVEHEARKRLATVRLLASAGVRVDLLFASSGIEAETVARASTVALALIVAWRSRGSRNEPRTRLNLPSPSWAQDLPPAHHGRDELHAVRQPNTLPPLRGAELSNGHAMERLRLRGRGQHLRNQLLPRPIRSKQVPYAAGGCEGADTKYSAPCRGWRESANSTTMLPSD